MAAYKFGTCEFSFPCWGAWAIKTAHEAGFAGMHLSDAGGYLQPHPQNNGYVEYERYGLDLRRKDAFPLTGRRVQEAYLESADRYRMELLSIYLYTLEHQGFIKYSGDTPQGRHCRESIQNGVLAAAQMGIPTVTIAVKGLFGTAQKQYALAMLRYAVERAEERGVRIAVTTDLPVREQLRLVDAFDGKLKLAFDAYAPFVCGAERPSGMVRALGKDRIDHVRMRDAHLDDEGFLTREGASAALLGQGDLHAADTARAVQAAGYTGWIIAETPYYHPDIQTAGEDTLSLAKRDVQTLETIFQKSCGDACGTAEDEG